MCINNWEENLCIQIQTQSICTPTHELMYLAFIPLQANQELLVDTSLELQMTCFEWKAV